MTKRDRSFLFQTYPLNLMAFGNQMMNEKFREIFLLVDFVTIASKKTY